ncbi:butyrophilin subfamily 2 member A1-like isoform X4 [Trachemys scripta elegans]|uniref:butyrophilin subfamily 2 member A1-like isoform X4 n=1 Tax=Trachemys scripta elegans TaxID=31138 RepID=UPI0015546F9B|nr:butyrophilin subfamily 2 member A1-like isoform X4 [Trachemys scripta elegans]
MKMRISFHSYCAMGNLSLCSYIIFFLMLHVSTLESVNFKVIGPDHPITVSAGEDALLPCHLSPSMNAQEMEVRWFQSKDSELVHLYQDGKDQIELQISKYRDRTELLKDGIVDGRVALHIRNITPSDQGQFICFFRSPSFFGEATLELKVTGLGSTPRISIDSYQSRGIHMVCESAGWYPKPQVQWRDLKGQHLPSLTEKIIQHDNGLFEAQISIIVTETSSQDLSCSVSNSHLNQGKESMVYIAGKLVADLEKHLAEKEKLQNELPSVILDPITAHPDLILSEDQTCVTKGDIAQNVPNNPERFDSSVCVLGSEGFTSGIHYWEMEVGNGGDWWAVGVARESIKRKGWLNFSPVEKIWAVECDWGKYQALDSSVIHLPLNERLGKIGVSLDFKEHHVAFYDIDNMVPIYTFKEVSFSDEKIFPFFCIWRTPGKYIKLCDREKS